MDAAGHGLQVAVDDDDDDDEIPARPSAVEYQELPVYGVPPPDRVYLLEATLQELERGVFRRAALLVDSMLRDDRIDGVVQTLTNSIIGAPQEWSPGDEKAKSQKICDEIEEQFPKICGPAEAAELLRWAALIGLGVGEIIWDQATINGKPRARPRVKVWHPQFVYWRWDTRSYWIITSDGMVEIVPGTGKWILLTPYGYNRAWLRGKVRSLARPWMQRCFAYRDAARWEEVYSLGIRKLITPVDADERTKKRIERQLANLAAESTVTCPQGNEDNKWDIEIVQADGQGFESILKYIRLLDESIAIDLLGQNLTTQVSEGSRAAAKVHNQVRGDILRFYAEAFVRCMREDVFEPYCKFNYGDPELAPYVELLTDPADDGQALAQEALVTFQALQLAQQLKIPVDVRAACDTHQIAIQAGAPEVIELEPPPAPMGPDGKPMKPGAKPGADDKKETPLEDERKQKDDK